MKINRLIITEEERNEIRSLYNVITEQPVAPPVPTIIKVSDEGSLAMDSTDAKGFLSKFVSDILTKINNDPEARNTMKNGKMEILSLIVLGGASNVWGGEPTGYDFENNRKTPGIKTETDLYQKNKVLSTKRSEQFKNDLIAELLKYNINVSRNVKITTVANVYNTGGVNDNDIRRDTKLYPKNGQFLSATIQLSFVNTDIFIETVKVEEIPKTEFNIETAREEDVPNMPKEFVITGAYFCDGKNSQNEDADDNTHLNQCKSLSATSKDHRHISSWEIKWAPKGNGDTNVIPVVRWNFYWSSGGTIDRVSRVPYKDEYVGKDTFGKLITANNNVGTDDKMLRYLMGLSGGNMRGDLNGGETYKTYIEPFKKYIPPSK